MWSIKLELAMGLEQAGVWAGCCRRTRAFSFSAAVISMSGIAPAGSSTTRSSTA